MGQSSMYSHLTDYQRTSSHVKTTLLVLSLWDNQTCTVTSLITRGPVVLLKQHCWFFSLWDNQTSTVTSLITRGPVVLLKQHRWFCLCETIKQVQSPHWLPEDQWSCLSNIVGFVTERQSNMYSHLTNYQRTRGPAKATSLVLSLWDNQTCTVSSLINRGPVVL